MKKIALLLTVVLLLTVFAGCQLADIGLPGSADATTEPEPSKVAVELPLTKQTAVQIALEHAGVANEEVVHLHTRLDTHTDVNHYDVDFRHGNFTYEYELNEQTGEVLLYEREYEPTGPSLPEQAQITGEDAQRIALEHAGFASDSVKALTVEYEADEHYFEVDFKKDGFEYNYEICAEFGKVLDADKERDD